MAVTKISPKHQITIPKEAFEKLRLEIGDFLEVEAIEEGLLLIPKKLKGSGLVLDKGVASKRKRG